MAADAGFDGIEVVLGPRTPLRRCESIARMAGDRGLRVYSVHESLLAGHLRQQSPADLLTRAVEAAVRMGAQVAVAHPPGTFGWRHPQAVAWLEALLRARDAMDSEGAAVTVENAGHCTPDDRRRVLAQLPSLVAFCRKHGLGMTLDTCRTGGSGLVGKLAHEHLFPGEGDLPLGAFLQQIDRVGYGGPVTMEVSMAALGGWRPTCWSKRLADLTSWARRWASQPCCGKGNGLSVKID